VQGAGHGVVTVRFETRSSGPGLARTFPADSSELTRANPVDSLDWPDYVGALHDAAPATGSTPAGEDVGGG
jgi:DNA polymerase-4